MSELKMAADLLSDSSAGVPSVLPKQSGGGPHGLGDPDDKTLRKVEVEVVIPKLMRDRAKTTKCPDEVAAFTECCKASSILMVVKCREQNAQLRDCLGRWYKDDGFKKICTEEYLKLRSEFRRTGVPIKHRVVKLQ